MVHAATYQNFSGRIRMTLFYDFVTCELAARYPTKYPEPDPQVRSFATNKNCGSSHCYFSASHSMFHSFHAEKTR
jgi:hypothetical protein